MESVKGSDNGKTVTVVFKTPFRDWKSMFASGNFILPSHYVKEQPGGWNTGLDKNPENIPSGGWFKVDNYTPGQSLTVVRNDKYFGQKSNLDSVVFRFLPESTTQPAALQNNEVDLIYPQPQLDQVTQVKALPDVTSQINFGPTFEHFDFNFKNEHLGDLKVRQAIAKGVNVEDLVNRTVKQFSDQAAPLGNRIYMTTQPDQYQDNFTEYGKGDTAAATALLEEAGYTKGGDGIYAKDGKKLSLRISTTAGNQLRETQEELFQAQMKEIGVDIKIANAESTKFFSDWLPNGNFDIANFAWVGSPFSISGSQASYITGSGSNYGAYSSKKVDDLFKQAMGEFDDAKATELGNQIDQQITADMATIPLYQKPAIGGFVLYLARLRIAGFWYSGIVAMSAVICCVDLVAQLGRLGVVEFGDGLLGEVVDLLVRVGAVVAAAAGDVGGLDCRSRTGCPPRRSWRCRSCRRAASR